MPDDIPPESGDEDHRPSHEGAGDGEPPHEPPGDGPSNDNVSPRNEPPESTHSGGMIIYTGRNPEVRQHVIGLMRSRIGSIQNDLTVMFKNFPGRILNQTISKGDLSLMKGDTIKLHNVPQLIDFADAKIVLALNAIMRDPQIVPTQLDIDNLKTAFKTLVFAQEQIKMVREVYSAPAHDPGMRQKGWQEQEEKKVQPEITVRDRHSFRPFRLDGVEQKTLDNVIDNLSYYIIASSYLLGATVKGSWMLEEGDNSPKYEIRRSELADLTAVAPPVPWAEGMKKMPVINVQVSDHGLFYSR
jgi:hypothetical protein